MSHSTNPRSPSALPRTVRIGAAFVLAYGVGVVINATYQQSLSEWEYWREFPRALIRLTGCGLVAFGLTRRSLWAWWVAVIVGGSFILLGTLGALGLTLGLHSQGAELPVAMLVASASLYMLLGAGLAFLLRRESREAFRVSAG